MRRRRLLASNDQIGVLSLGQMVQSASLLGGELLILLAQSRHRRHHIHIEKGASFLPSLMQHLMHVVLRVRFLYRVSHWQNFFRLWLGLLVFLG